MDSKPTSFMERPEVRFGFQGERRIADEWEKRGWFVIRCFDFSGADGNTAPRMRQGKESHALPDLALVKDGRFVWCEVKTKTTAPHNRTYDCAVHGIGKSHYEDYRRVQAISGQRVLVVFYETDTGKVLWSWLDDLTPIQENPSKKDGVEEAVTLYFRREALKLLWDLAP